MATHTHAGDAVVAVRPAMAIAYRCRCGWSTEALRPEAPGALAQLKAAMAEHVALFGAPPTPDRAPGPGSGPDKTEGPGLAPETLHQRHLTDRRPDGFQTN